MAALALTTACGDDAGGGPANEAGSGGETASGGSESGGSNSGGSDSGGSDSGGSSAGGSSNGGASNGGAGGSGGSSPGALTGVLSMTSAGTVATSDNFTLISTVGETPGGNITMTSANNRLDLGFIGATH